MKTITTICALLFVALFLVFGLAASGEIMCGPDADLHAAAVLLFMSGASAIVCVVFIATTDELRRLEKEIKRKQKIIDLFGAPPAHYDVTENSSPRCKHIMFPAPEEKGKEWQNK